MLGVLMLLGQRWRAKNGERRRPAEAHPTMHRTRCSRELIRFENRRLRHDKIATQSPIYCSKPSSWGL